MISEVERVPSEGAETGLPDEFAVLMGALLDPDMVALSGSAFLQHTMEDRGLGLSQTRALLRDPRALSVLDAFAENPDSDQMRNAAAEVLTTYPLDTLPAELQIRIPRQFFPATMRLAPFYREWVNCVQSEDLLEESLSRVAIVNGFLAVKDIGHLTGLALDSVSTRQGTFIEGCWYSPTDEATINTLDKPRESEPTHLYIERSSWAYIRPVYVEDCTPREFLEDVRQTLRPGIYA